CANVAKPVRIIYIYPVMAVFHICNLKLMAHGGQYHAEKKNSVYGCGQCFFGHVYTGAGH
ncbi:hypothetical protein, partial [Thiolapillus sp.]